MLFVSPDTLPLVLLRGCEHKRTSHEIAVTNLPALTQTPQALPFGRAGFGEQVAIHHRVQKPLPILRRHVGDEPRVALAMEANFRGEAALDEEIGCISTISYIRTGNCTQATYHRRSRNITRNQRCPI